MAKSETAGRDMSMKSLAEIASGLRAGLEDKSRCREAALKLCRETIQASARAIRALHRREWDEAAGWIATAREKVDAVRATLLDHPDLYHAGYVNDSQKEYVEAETVRAIVQGQAVPSPEELGAEPAAYLNGLAEAGSECRRYVLDRLREGDTSCAERVLSAMDEIYDELITFDFPDAMTAGLRRTTDAFRAVLERTRGDLTLTAQQKALEDAIRKRGVAP